MGENVSIWGGDSKRNKLGELSTLYFGFLFNLDVLVDFSSYSSNYTELFVKGVKVSSV